MSGRPRPRLRHRPVRTVPAVLVALVLAGAGGLLVWWAVVDLSQRHWPGVLAPLHHWAAGLTWGSRDALEVSIGAVVLGALLLLCALVPGKHNALRLSAEPHGLAGDRELVMSRRSVARLASAYAIQLDGVDAVSATVGARRVRLSVRSPSQQRTEVGQRVTAGVRSVLQAAGVDPLPRITTIVSTRSL